jgi:hypothetical protein
MAISSCLDLLMKERQRQHRMKKTLVDEHGLTRGFKQTAINLLLNWLHNFETEKGWNCSQIRAGHR